MATDLVTIATTAVLSQFLGPSAKHLGEEALERGKQIVNKAVAYLAAVGRKPQHVEPKILIPLVQAAALETDSTLADKWAALLANAADPAQHVAVHPSYADILRQLTSAEAMLLDEFFTEVYNAAILTSFAGKTSENAAKPKDYATKHLVSAYQVYYKSIKGKFEGVPESEMRHSFDTMMDNLIRQRILVFASAQPALTHSRFAYKSDSNRALFTLLGYDFMRAVTPPTP